MNIKPYWEILPIICSLDRKLLICLHSANSEYSAHSTSWVTLAIRVPFVNFEDLIFLQYSLNSSAIFSPHPFQKILKHTLSCPYGSYPGISSIPCEFFIVLAAQFIFTFYSHFSCFSSLKLAIFWFTIIVFAMDNNWQLLQLLIVRKFSIQLLIVRLTIIVQFNN